MSIETDIVKVKNNIALIFADYPQITILREQIESLKLYKERKVIPGLQAGIKAYSDGGSLSSGSDQRVKAIDVEIANLTMSLVAEALPNDTDF